MYASQAIARSLNIWVFQILIIALKFADVRRIASFQRENLRYITKQPICCDQDLVMDVVWLRDSLLFGAISLTYDEFR